jgi:chromosome segregation ATPase
MQIGGLRSDIGDYKTQIGGLQSDIGGYKSQIGGLQGQIGGLQADIGGYKGQIGQLQGDIKGYQGEISGLRGDVLGLRGDISNYQERERQAKEMQIRDAQRQRVAASYGLGKKKAKVGGVKTGRIEEEARMYGPRAAFNRSGLRISSLNI